MVWPLAIFGETVRAADMNLAFWAHSGHTGRPWLERLARRTAPDFAISTSHFVASSLSSVFPHAPAQVVYAPVPNGDSSEKSLWRAAVRQEQGVPESTAVIIQVSRFEPWKGHLLHLRALSHIKDVPGWVCWMVGAPHNTSEDRYFQEVQQASSTLGLSDRIRFLGRRSDVERLLAGADIFCQPNQGPEPFGIVFVEALRAGRPVVTTSIGGALEIVDASCGVLLKPNDSEGLADALRRLIASTDVRSRLGQNGPARARQLCDPQTQMSLLAQVLRNMAINRK
jgi:glycosyltransferase involved in cell wall biosynthesis